jgi:hypothetical protein
MGKTNQPAPSNESGYSTPQKIYGSGFNILSRPTYDDCTVRGFNTVKILDWNVNKSASRLYINPCGNNTNINY